MAQLEALRTIKAAIISLSILSLSSCKAILPKSSASSGRCEISLFANDKTIVIKSEDFVLSKNDVGYHLVILNQVMLAEVLDMVNPTMKFCDMGRICIAKPNNIYSSILPDNADFFFPVDKERKMYLFKGGVIDLKRIKN